MSRFSGPPRVGTRELDRARLPERLAACAIDLPPDPETARWLAEVGSRPHGALATALHRALRHVASDYDVDGWLGTHAMHLCGPASWRGLLGGSRPGGALLDVGAGDGGITATLAPLFDRVVATETSAPMVRRLRARGFDAHRLDLTTEPLPAGAGPFRVVSFLNVIDRCARPLSLLRAGLERLGPDGRVLLATPLPLSPHVDVGGHTVDPDEPLAVDEERFEDALAALVSRVLEREGLVLERWARVPYLCRGDGGAALYELDDAVLVLARR